jgi:hypothetical protein
LNQQHQSKRDVFSKGRFHTNIAKHSLIAAVANGDLGFASEADGSDAQKDKKGRKDTKQKMNILVPPSHIHPVTNKNTTFKLFATFI